MTMKRSHQRVMDLWDAGLSIEKIAAATGKPRNTVKIIVSTYDGISDFRRHKAEMATASASFLRALSQQVLS